MRFELVCISRQGKLVRDAVEANTSLEKSRKINQRLEDGISAGAAAHDDRFSRIGFTLLRQVCSPAD